MSKLKIITTPTTKAAFHQLLISFWKVSGIKQQQQQQKQQQQNNNNKNSNNSHKQQQKLNQQQTNNKPTTPTEQFSRAVTQLKLTKFQCF